MVCIGSLFFFLGETLFNTRGEPREAVVALSMLQDGNWILPINNGVDMAYKPPLFHWLVALFSLPLGEVTEYTSRLPSAVALTLIVMTGYAFYAKRSGALTALLMGLITLSNFEVHRAGVNCRVDMVLTAMMVVALYQLYRWTEGGFGRLPIWGILALSGAFPEQRAGGGCPALLGHGGLLHPARPRILAIAGPILWHRSAVVRVASGVVRGGLATGRSAFPRPGVRGKCAAPTGQNELCQPHQPVALQRDDRGDGLRALHAAGAHVALLCCATANRRATCHHSGTN